jgi:hypothetical protein
MFLGILVLLQPELLGQRPELGSAAASTLPGKLLPGVTTWSCRCGRPWQRRLEEARRRCNRHKEK